MRFSAPNLVCTVGTSLFSSNLNQLDPKTWYVSSEEKPVSQDDYHALDKMGLITDSRKRIEILTDIKTAHSNKDYDRIGALFTRLPPELRLMGAEINSIEAMVRKSFLPVDRARLILLVSDTPDGEAIGKILTSYFSHRKCPIGFSQCTVEVVKGLQDEKPLVFQRDGLTNLVRLLGDHYRQWGGAIAINATGGYKAQIALAVAFGQAIGSTVYYKHERFDQIIRFPQIPFTLDLFLVQNHLKLWADLTEQGRSFLANELNKRLPADVFESIYPFLEEIEEEGEVLYGISALGMVYWESFRSLYPEVDLACCEVSARRGCKFRDDHYPIGFKEYVNRFYDAFPNLVSECHSIPYDGQAAIKTRFLVRENSIIGEYKDGNNFGARFEVMTTAENELERHWLAKQFSSWIATPDH